MSDRRDTDPVVVPVVVIGADSPFGRAVMPRLATDGLRAIGAVRNPQHGAAKTIEWRTCDTNDAASVAAALAGAATAVNCVMGDAATMVSATRNLCAAAHAAGLRRLLHISSMAVYGGATGLVDEAHPLDAGAGWYAQARITCETLVRDYVAAGGDAVILRPGCIHGPHSAHWTVRIGRLLQRHRIGDLGAAGDGLCNLIHVDDAAAAIVAALRKPGIAGEAFNVSDPDPTTWNAYFMRFGQAIGATPISRISARWLKLETTGLAPLLKAAQLAAARVGLDGAVPDPVPKSLLSLWQQDIQLDHRKADATLAFPRTPPEAALADAAAWFTAQH